MRNRTDMSQHHSECTSSRNLCIEGKFQRNLGTNHYPHIECADIHDGRSEMKHHIVFMK